MAFCHLKSFGLWAQKPVLNCTFITTTNPPTVKSCLGADTFYFASNTHTYTNPRSFVRKGSHDHWQANDLGVPVALRTMTYPRNQQALSDLTNPPFSCANERTQFNPLPTTAHQAHCWCLNFTWSNGQAAVMEEEEQHNGNFAYLPCLHNSCHQQTTTYSSYDPRG